MSRRTIRMRLASSSGSSGVLGSTIKTNSGPQRPPLPATAPPCLHHFRPSHHLELPAALADERAQPRRVLTQELADFVLFVEVVYVGDLVPEV